MSTIQKTKDYSQFKLLKGNRPIDRYHLKKIKESITKDNQLHLHPIIVNGNFEVIDGQTRLQAAKELNIEVYYVQDSKVTDEHLIDCNVNQKSWEVENYIDYFCARDKIPDYVELDRLQKATGLRPKALLNLVLGTVSSELLMFLKTGKFRLPSDKSYEKVVDHYQDFLAFVQDKRIKPGGMFSNFYFAKAFRWLCHTTDFDYGLFKQKLELRWFELRPHRDPSDWYKCLVNIYNYKNRSAIEVEYGTEKN